MPLHWTADGWPEATVNDLKTNLPVNNAAQK
jgi:hypothetical protein